MAVRGIGLILAMCRAGRNPSDEIACSINGSSLSTVLTARGRFALLGQSREECPMLWQVQHFLFSLATSSWGHLTSAHVPPHLAHMRGPCSAPGRLVPLQVQLQPQPLSKFLV